jgi:hypothetical protein
MDINGRMSPFLTFPGMAGRGIKNGGGGKFNYDI